MIKNSTADVYKIIIQDNDYRHYFTIKYLVFKSKEEAEEYCRKNSWSGETYYVGKLQ